MTDPTFLWRCSLTAGSRLGAAPPLPSLGLHLQLAPKLMTELVYMPHWLLQLEHVDGFWGTEKEAICMCKESWSKLAWWRETGRTLCQLVGQYILTGHWQQKRPCLPDAPFSAAGIKVQVKGLWQGINTPDGAQHRLVFCRASRGDGSKIPCLWHCYINNCISVKAKGNQEKQKLLSPIKSRGSFWKETTTCSWGSGIKDSWGWGTGSSSSSLSLFLYKT